MFATVGQLTWIRGNALQHIRYVLTFSTVSQNMHFYQTPRGLLFCFWGLVSGKACKLLAATRVILPEAVAAHAGISWAPWGF